MEELLGLFYSVDLYQEKSLEAKFFKSFTSGEMKEKELCLFLEIRAQFQEKTKQKLGKGNSQTRSRLSEDSLMEIVEREARKGKIKREIVGETEKASKKLVNYSK